MLAFYHELKDITSKENIKIGIVKNIFQFDPLRRWNLMDWTISKILNDVYTNDPLTFLKTGKFKFFLPGANSIEFERIDAKESMDFIGLNYYSRLHVKSRFNIKNLFTRGSKKRLPN